MSGYRIPRDKETHRTSIPVETFRRWSPTGRRTLSFTGTGNRGDPSSTQTYDYHHGTLVHKDKCLYEMSRSDLNGKIPSVRRRIMS